MVTIGRELQFIMLYSFTHLIVDAACAFLLLGVLDISEQAILYLLLYNSIAFVFQAPFGYIIDKALNPKFAAILGLFFVAVSFLFWNKIFIAIIIVSIGNALFHVGGGSLVLSLKSKKATFSGIYVAQGGIGLALGSLFAVMPINIHLLFFSFILITLCLILYFIEVPDFNRTNERKGKINLRILIVVLIMIPIAIRSLIGLSLEFPWKENQVLLIILVIAIALGKIFGGVLADRYGLKKVGVGGLLLSIPFLSLFSSVPLLGILGAFIFNFSMPVTLIAMFSIMPDHKGLSFGLTTVALFIGALPVIIGEDMWIKNDFVIFSFIIASTIFLFAAMQLIDKLKKQRSINDGL